MPFDAPECGFSVLNLAGVIPSLSVQALKNQNGKYNGYELHIVRLI